MNPRLKHVGLSLARTPCVLRDVRLHDGSPAEHTNVLSSDCVRMTSVATRHTAEGCLVGAISLVRMPTGRTAARGVAGIDQHHGNTNPLCFVADTCAELKERPTMQLSTLLPPSPHPRANALEVFQADRALCAFGSLNNALADRVIHVFGETAFLTGKLFQSPPRRFGAELLEFGAQPPMAVAHGVHHAAAVDRAVRIAGDVRHTQINPKHVVNVLRIGFFHVARYQQIPVPAMEQQITFTVSGCKHPPLMVSGNVQLWHVYVLMFVRSSMQAFQQPAAAASTAMLVPPAWLPRAAGMNQALVGVMTIASAPLGALALAFLPLHSALLIDVVTALLGIAPLFVFTIPQVRSESSISNSMWADLKAGGTYIVRRRGLLMLYLVVGLVVLTIMPTFSLTPLLVKEWFRGGVNQVAFMEALAGIGIILGGVLIGLWPGPRRRIVTVLVSFAVSCGTVALTALAPRDMLLLATFWWFVSGVTFATGNAPMMAILQSTVPNTMQGRVLSLLNTVTGLAGPIGLAIAGPLGEALGARAVFIIGGALAALICLLGLLSPALMRIEETAM